MEVTFEKLFYYANLPFEVDCLGDFFLRCTTKDEKFLVLSAFHFFLVF
jgi:hypothetical protein